MPAFGQAQLRADNSPHQLRRDILAIVGVAGAVIFLHEEVTKLRPPQPGELGKRAYRDMHALGQVRVNLDFGRERC